MNLIQFINEWGNWNADLYLKISIYSITRCGKFNGQKSEWLKVIEGEKIFRKEQTVFIYLLSLLSRAGGF